MSEELKRLIREIHGSHHVGDAQHTKLELIEGMIDASQACEAELTKQRDEYLSITAACRDACGDWQDHPEAMGDPAEVPAVVKRLREKLEAAEADKAREVEFKNAELAKLRDKKFAKFNSEDCWIFQDDGTDELQSLVCPVVIKPARLIELLAADARIKASQEQEPVGEVLEFIGDEKFIVRINRPTNVGELLWPAALIPPELAELQRENAELRGRTDSLEVVALRKENAELRKSLRIEELFRLNKMTKPATGHDYWKNWYEAKLTAETAELRKLLESKVPEEALIEIVTQAHMAGQFNQSQRDPSYYEARVYYGEKQLSIRAMLAAAPQPKEPKQSPETDLDEALRRQ